jgi:hypothetical protein
MEEKILRSTAQLEKKFVDAIDTIEEACNLYDQGNALERRVEIITTKLRVFFSEYGQKPLLKALIKRQDTSQQFSDEILSTAFRYNPKTQHMFSGLTCMGYNEVERNWEQLPLLTPKPEEIRWTPIDKWWKEEIILIGPKKIEYTREGLSLVIADKESVHVDQKLPDDWELLQYIENYKKGVFGNREVDKETKDIIKKFPSHRIKCEHYAIRQIGHEVLKTFKPGYEKEVPENISLRSEITYLKRGAPGTNELEIGGFLDFRKKGASFSLRVPFKPKKILPAQYKDIQRNDPCFCGSGKKFKKCCMPIYLGRR